MLTGRMLTGAEPAQKPVRISAEDWRVSRRRWGSAWDFLQWYMLAPEKPWKLTFSSTKLFPVLFEEDDVRNQQTEIFPERLTGATA